MFKRFSSIAAAALAASACLTPAEARPDGPLEAQSFPIGTQGALCEAQGVTLGNARNSVFDRKWALICRDVSQPVGAAYSWRDLKDVQGRVSTSRGTPLDCDEAGGAVTSSAGVTVRRCLDPKTGLQWIRYTATSGDWVHVVEGLSAYDSALRLALANLMQDRVVPGEVSVVTTGGSDSLAEARASVGNAALLIGQGYRQNNAGDYAEAEQYFSPQLLNVAQAKESPQAAALLAARRHELIVNRALQLSNLGRYAEAQNAFAQADAMGLRDPIQARLSRNFEAIDALNRGQLDQVATILARPVPALSTPAEPQTGAVAIGAPLADSLNAGLAAGLTDPLNQETRLSTVERAKIIDAQAHQIGATVLRLTGKPDEALAQLTAARDQILQVKEGRVLSTARLLSQIDSEMALANEAQGRFPAAENLLRDAVTLTQQRYPDSAAVSEAQARLAAYLTRRGRNDEAMQIYGGIVHDISGRRDALVGLEHQIEPYFQLLVDGLPQKPEYVAELFQAAQLVERPGAAQTLSQLTRRLAAGNSQASDLFRRETNVERQINQTNVALAQLRTGQGATGAQAAELQDTLKRLQQNQLDLVNSLSAYPAYRSLAHTYVSADDMRALLKPGEAYLKLVKVGDDMFAVFISPQRSTGWKVGASATQIADLVSKLRDSISVTVGGVAATYPFDVDSSRALFGDLFAPVAGDLARVHHLIFEPDGALLQLPINLLIADQAGVDAYHKKVAAGGDEFDFRGIDWLGRNTAISTALSPASFRDMRNAPSSKAGEAYLGLGQNQPVGKLTRAALVRGVPESDDPGCDIPLAAWNNPIPPDELKLASQVFGPNRSQLITGAAFTDTAVQNDPSLDNFRIIHFATHGLVAAPKAGCPAKPALLTSFGGQGSDGLLEFGDIFDLKLDADLVILSACNTASQAGLEATQQAGIDGGGGQALDGLVRAFIGAGGRQVIASHWPAPEEYGATKRLFEGLFESPPGESLGVALLNAQRKLMDDPETSHPFYWSGFALIGDGERPLIPSS